MLKRRMQPKPNDRVRLFRNPWLEGFTVVSLRNFLIIWTLLIPVVFWLAMRSAGAAGGVGLFLAGLLVWSLTEYALHRCVFHWQPRWAPMARLMFMIHGNHHLAPNDPMRNLMPPIVSVPVCALVWAGCVAMIGPAGIWVSLGFMVGYVSYDLVHFGCHQWPMRDRIMGVFKTNHMRHHHARISGNFAITGMFWDRLLGTRISTTKS
jgi:sterol desaturase/sphingolipid hydroxylase (fatty acid hydroxylase superfamily)